MSTKNAHNNISSFQLQFANSEIGQEWCKLNSQPGINLQVKQKFDDEVIRLTTLASENIGLFFTSKFSQIGA